MSDPFDLERFVTAQAPVFDQVTRELRAGRKTSHWMWFIFPQIAGLGASAMSARYAIHSRAEGLAHLDHRVLGSRLDLCVSLVNGLTGLSAHDVFGFPDDVKFHSSMTLFAALAGEGSVHHHALAKYFGGAPDPRTIEFLKSAP